MKHCVDCFAELPDQARYCFHCGAAQPEKKDVPGEKVFVDLKGDPEQQLNEQFFLALKERIQAEHRPDLFQRYSERVYETTFRDTVARKAEQIAADLADREAAGTLDLRRLNRNIEQTFENLLDYFLIRYCQDLNEVVYPEAILKYQNATWDTVDLFAMMQDYLDLENEDLQIYTDFLTMPLEKLRNAGKRFLFPAKDEKMLLLCDLSILGNGREGFALTERALYWRAAMQKPRAAYFDRLISLEREKDWILINDHFFNVNRSVNLKMLKLLKKIRRMWKMAA